MRMFTRARACTPTCPARLQGVGPDVVYSFTPPTDMVVSLSTCGSSYDTVLYAGEGGLLPGGQQLASNDDDRGCVANPSASRLDLRLTAGRPYFFAVDGFSGSAGLYVFNMSCASCAQRAGGAAAAVAGVSMIAGAWGIMPAR